MSARQFYLLPRFRSTVLLATAVIGTALVLSCSKDDTGSGGGTGGQSSGAGGAGVGGAGTGGSASGGNGSGGSGQTSGSGGVGSGGVTGSGGSGSGGVTGSGGSSSGGATGTGGTGVAGETGRGGSGAAGAGGVGAAGGMGTAGAGGSAIGGAGGMAAVIGPCDIFASGSTPCVAAHSTVRALYSAYNGRLYQVMRASDKTTKDIPVVGPGGVADSGVQDGFCSGTTCVITLLYDQSGKGNRLEYQGPGSSVGGVDTAATATSESLTVNGQKVYSLYINPHNSYWRDGHLTGVPTGSAPEGLYMVTSGTHVNSGCCFDYGNSETNRMGEGNGAMDAINFGTECWFGGCVGSGPWVQADLEDGLFPGGGKSNPNQKSFPIKYVTAMLKNNGTAHMALKGANAQSGDLVTLWDGVLPPGYGPMRKQGAIVLGSGGDCCATNQSDSAGTFYEGAIVSGYPSDATDTAVQANIVAAGYGGPP
jgi:non-reducing end alpha-L-arabinofuranosidase